MKRFYHFKLKEHENAALITNEGIFIKGVAHNAEDIKNNADLVQGILYDLMKNSEPTEGCWIWKISDDWSTISGWEICFE